MSNNWSRYTTLYRKAVRPNRVTPFPLHVFMRNQTRFNHKQDRLGDRVNCFESTFVHLTERYTGRELFLIGTLNSSTMLSKRTKKLIQEIKPDTVLVMCSQDWWNHARLIQNVTSQEEFNIYQDKFLSKVDKWPLDSSFFRGIVFWSRIWMMKMYLKINFYSGSHFKFYIPGLEIKYACEAAEKVGAKLMFLGPELNNVAWHRLYHETRINIPQTVMNTWRYLGTRWTTEARTENQKLELTTPSSFSEVWADSYLINWYIKRLEILVPSLKRIFIDKRDIGLYKRIVKNNDGKRIVAVVNQWHMEGIEHLWAHEFGQLPRSQLIREEIDPIGDMNLRKGLFDMMYNAFQRQYKCANSKSVPSSYSNMMNTYHREQNWGYEHRNM